MFGPGDVETFVRERHHEAIRAAEQHRLALHASQIRRPWRAHLGLWMVTMGTRLQASERNLKPQPGFKHMIQG